jgi:uncharacterized protein YtpQ (UPF0354 family)
MAIEWLKKFSKKATRSRPHASQSSISQPSVSQPDNDWRYGLSKPDLTHAEFCSLCADAVRSLVKDATLEQSDSMGEIRVKLSSGESITIFLNNLWRRTRGSPDARAQEIERFLTAMMKSALATPAHDKNSIVPMIKDEQYLKEIGRPAATEDTTVTEHLAADLWIVYAFDTPETMLTMQQKQLRELELKRQDLRPLAVENLRRILPPIMQHGDGPVYLLTAGADYVASLLLFDDVWDELQETIEGDIVAAVPSRDVLLFTDSTLKEGIEELRASITRITNSGGYLVSSTMFRRTTDGWKPFS